MCLGEDAVNGTVPSLNGLAVSGYGNVAIHESDFFGHCIVREAILHGADGKAIAAPCKENHRIDEQRQDEINKDTANHDEETLPYGLCTELILLNRLFHLFSIHALINHSSNLDIAAERYPADTVLRLAGCYFRKEACKPFVLGGEEVELPIKEHVELLYLNLEEFGKEEMTALVQDDKKGEAENQL